MSYPTSRALRSVQRTILLERALARAQSNHHHQMIRLRNEGVKTVTQHHGGWKTQCTASSCREASNTIRGLGSKAQ